MKKNLFAIPGIALALSMAAGAQSATVSTKVGIIHIQNAIISTKDGQKAANELQTKFAPKKQALEKQQSDIAQIEDQIRKGSNTMSDAARQKLMSDRDVKAKQLSRENDDFQTDVAEAENKIMQDLGQRIMAVIDKYAKDNGYSLIIDVSSPQTPVLYAANSIDITKEIIDLYDKNAPTATPQPTSAAPAARPAVPPAAVAPRPVAPPKPSAKK